MIGHLRGTLAAKKPPTILVDVAGVGYDVHCSMFTIYKLPAINNQVCIHIHMVVREDAQLLFGFHDEIERLVFRELIKISGVGPKLALAILSGMDVKTFCQCIEAKDTAMLVKLPGVGKKTAERLVIEIKDRLAKILPINMEFSDVLLATTGGTQGTLQQQEAVSALVSLGYKMQEANKIVDKIDVDETTNSETLIKMALQSVAKG